MSITRDGVMLDHPVPGRRQVVQGFEIAGVAIVLVRTFLSFSLEIELEGTLPWRRGPQRRRSGPSQ